MAKFRMVHTDFWDDPKVVEEMTPEDKYFFLYLLTNKNTTQIGIYQITKKQMSFDLGYTIESINALMDRFVKHHKLVLYNPDTREIAIKNWGKYNFNKGGKPVLDCVKSELKMVKDISLIQFVGERIEKVDIKKLYDSYTIREEKTDDDGKKCETLLNQCFDDTSSIGGQEEEKEEEKEEQQEKEKEKEEVAEIIQFWDDNGFGFSNIHSKESLLLWLDDSKFPRPKDIILKALSIACHANKRQGNYVEGILRKWENRSLLTVEEIDQDVSRAKQTNNTRYDPSKDSF
ncbi:DnaD domain-containing protein [Bacillus sp. CGMCC 1.16607]|uniref:DnaD domain-containing protein n=1 Tax=Bacillus sp. CGMCC 1.16607 TaxID=3351842 RepID=UPI00363960DA